MVCQVYGTCVVCEACKREMATRELIIELEREEVMNVNLVAQYTRDLQRAQAREEYLTQRLVLARTEAAQMERQRGNRSEVVSLSRGRERAADEAEVEEVAGPAGSACPAGWQSRRTKVRRSMPLVLSPECMICTEPNELGVVSRCKARKCTFETCRTCWVKQAHVDGRCPMCRVDIELSDGEDEEE